MTARENSKNLAAPDWLKYKGKTFTRTFSVINSAVQDSGIATVCEEAKCPNRTECWSGGTSTFMLMGDTCTRNCKFCAVKTSDTPPALNPAEPETLIKILDEWSHLSYIVLTSVDRDDLPDGGSLHLAKCIRAVKAAHPEVMIEILIPDFQDSRENLKNIVEAKPDVIAHNIETIERLQKKARDSRAGYKQSMHVLQMVKELDPSIYTKSSIMVGLGESYNEVLQTMQDLLDHQVDFLTIGQYMRPTLKNLRVREYVEPDVFSRWEQDGLQLGFKYVASGPLVRSSYKAGEFFIKSIITQEKAEN